MLRIALKNVLARKGRLLLSSLAVIAGCAFLSGVFVFSDTIRDSIDRTFATAYENTDAYVRSAFVIESDFGEASRGRISDSLIEGIQSIPGIAEVEGDVQSFARISTSDGDEIGFDGPPKFGGVYTGSEISPWDLDEGAVPHGPGEVVIDKQSAKTGDVAVGDTVTITATGEPRDFTVVGIVTFGGADSTGGPTWALFDLATAEEFVIGIPGTVDSILIRGDGSRSEAELQADIQTLFEPDEIEVLTGQEIIAESQSDLAEDFGFFATFLTVFAGIALFVGSFIIYNVF
ncbi:MAG: ABC transporter permease, partial [Ilumatobacteraceae bacterium]